MPPDYTNWVQEREKLKQEILNDLRTFRDKGSYQRLQGVYTLNVLGKFKLVGDKVKVGPIYFKTAFRNAPVVTFGPQLVDETKVFVAIPYVLSWHIVSGTVDGFNLGLYAVTTVPSGLEKHSIHWEASGIGSAYRREQTQEAWQVPYDRQYSQGLVVPGDKTDTLT